LIKGARTFQFEEIVYLLEEKTHETVLEINLNAISHNLNFYKSKLKPKVKMMVMVKAFGYGNGGLKLQNY
jgi:alanine racemase